MGVFSVKCPNCGIELEAEEKFLGYIVSCANCDYHFTLWTPENNLPHYPDELEQFKPGVLAKVGLPLSFRSPLFTEEQLALLLSEEDTKRIFHFSFPLLRPHEDGTEINGNRRYWNEPIELFGKKYLISKEWFDYNRKLIIFWLQQMRVDFSILYRECQSNTDIKACKKINDITIDEGVIALTEFDALLAHTKPSFVSIFEEKYELNTWKEVLCVIVSWLYKSVPDKVNKLTNTAFSTFSKRICIKNSQNQLIAGVKIAENVWIETNFSARDIVRLAHEIVELCEYSPNEFKITFKKKNTTQKENKKNIVTINSVQKTDTSFSIFSNFDFSYTILRELYKNGFDFEKKCKELQTLQWCQHNLNLRLPLLRKLKPYESIEDYKESYRLIASSSVWMVCQIQDDLNRSNLLLWAEKYEITIAEIEKLLNVKVVNDFDKVFSVDSIQNKSKKLTAISDNELLLGALTSLYKRKLLTEKIFNNFQDMHFCLENFNISHPIICRHYPYMRKEDFEKDYCFWGNGPQDTPCLILHRFDEFNKAAFIDCIQNLNLSINDLAADLNCEVACLLNNEPENCLLDPHKVSCDIAIYNFLDQHQGAHIQEIIIALKKAGHDEDKISRRLERIEGIVCNNGCYYHSTVEQNNLNEKEIIPDKQEQGELIAQTFISNDEIDRMLLEFVTNTPGQKRDDIINHLVEKEIPEQRAETRLRRHNKIFCIVEQYYSTEGIYGFDEAADVIWESLNDLFEQNNGYTSAKELYRAASGKLDDFFYDNDAFDSEVEIYQLAQYLFETLRYKDELFLFHNRIHIWRKQPDYPMGDHGLLIHWARSNNGLLTTSIAYTNFLRRGVAEGSKTAIFSLAMDKVYDRFWMIDASTFLLKDDIQITESQLKEIKVALDNLYDAFDYNFIPMWDIAEDWFDSLPRIIAGQSWTPMLLQSVLRDYSEQLQYRTIPRIEHRQQHAAVVEVNSVSKDYSDLVYNALKAEFKTPSIRISRNDLFDLLIRIGLWPEDVSPSYGSAFQNLFKDNFHFHVPDKNTVEVG